MYHNDQVKTTSPVASEGSASVKEEEYLVDEDEEEANESSEFIENPISSPIVKNKYQSMSALATAMTPLRLSSIRSPRSATSSSVKRRSMMEFREKRNSRLFNTGNNADLSVLLNETLNINDNEDILDFDTSILPNLTRSKPSHLAQTTTASSTHIQEVEQLRRKVTGYQLQLRLIMDFLKENGTNDLLQKLSSTDFDIVPSGASHAACSKCNDKDKEKMELKQDLINLQNRLRPLELRLKTYLDQLELTTTQLQTISGVLDNSEQLTDDIIGIIERQEHDLKMRSKIEQAKEKGMDVKLLVAIMALEGRKGKASSNSSSLLKLSPSLLNIQQLSSKLQQVQQKLELSQQQFLEIEHELQVSTKESKHLIELYSILWDLYKKQQGQAYRHTAGPQEEHFFDNFDNNNVGSTSGSDNSPVETKIRTSNSNIELLKTISSLENDKLMLSEDLNSSKNSVNELESQLNRLQSDSDKKIDSLQLQISQLQEQIEEKEAALKKLQRQFNETKLNSSFQAKEDRLKVDELKKELNLAVEKQKSLTGEKFQLRLQLDLMLREKQMLEKRLTQQQQQQQQQHDEEKSKFWNLRYEELLLSDTRIISRFLNIFEDILDTQSISQLKIKVAELSKRSTAGSGTGKNQLRVKELHESIFHYYVNALQAVVKDYLSTIKQIELIEKEKNFKIQQLSNELKSLQERGHSRSSSRDTSRDTSFSREHIDNDDNSILKYRIEDLSKKWKLEREARKMENESLQKRLREIELENDQLKQKLKELK